MVDDDEVTGGSADGVHFIPAYLGLNNEAPGVLY